MACRNAELGEKTRNEMKERFPQSSIHLEVVDVANNDSIENFAKVIEEKYKTIDILLNNAGGAAKGDAFDSEVANFTFGIV